MRAVELAVKSPSRAYEAIRHLVATDNQAYGLAAAIVDSRDKYNTMLLLHLCHDKKLKLPYALLARAAQLFVEVRSTKFVTAMEHTMECLALLPAHKKLARVRMALLGRLLRGPIKVWLKGEGIRHNVYPLFRKANFLPEERKRMMDVVERSRNHVWVDLLADFQFGLFPDKEWEQLQQMAMYFHSLEQKRKQKAAA